MGLWDHIKGEWPVLKQAPLSFTVLLALGLAAGFGSGMFVRQQEVANAQSSEHLAEMERDNYKDAASGLDPVHLKGTLDNLQSTVSDLESKVSGVEPKSLTATQIAAIKTSLSGTKGTVEVAHDVASPLTRTVANQLVQAFQAGGWNAGAAMIVGLGNPPKTGISVEGTNAAEMRVLSDALAAAHIPSETRMRSGEPSSGATLVVVTDPSP